MTSANIQDNDILNMGIVKEAQWKWTIFTLQTAKCYNQWIISHICILHHTELKLYVKTIQSYTLVETL